LVRQRTDEIAASGLRVRRRTDCGCSIIRLKEKVMSKGQRGNKEAKKPKKVHPAVVPAPPSAVVPAALPDRVKRK